MRLSNRRQRRRRQQRGFTLPELLISVLMVVLLMLGVNTVFRMSSDTVGVGQTVNRQTRDTRSASAVMAEDCKRWAPDSPLFFISSESRPRRDKDGKHAEDLNNILLYNRMDTMGFTARGSFRRHTANDGSFVSDTTALEAWIWYGHLEADGGNVPNVFGRVQLLLKDEAAIQDDGNEKYVQVVDQDGLMPLRSDTPTTQSPWELADSRFDLVGLTIDGLRAIVRRERGEPDGANNARWWSDVVYRRGSTNETFRYRAKTIVPRPIDSARMAQVAPVLLTDCEEFRVEFAGDYFTQQEDPSSSEYGKPIKAEADGKIDFVARKIGNNEWVQSVRWYGLGRDVDGDRAATWDRDVVPVADVYNELSEKPQVYPFYFERELRQTRDEQRYTVVFCDDAPKLVRVAVKLIDPAGRIQDGTWSEYVLGPQ